jgi:phosphoglycolate phosphatase-like HAD superfamily hydrolase
MKIFIDLDGTLLDVRSKYTKLYEEFLGHPIDDHNLFWDLKRSGACDKEIFKLLGINVDISEFRNFKIKNIELENYLAYDSLLPGVAAYLDDLAKNYPLYVLTIRKNQSNLINQLNDLGIKNFFQKIISPSADLFDLPGCDQKSALIDKLFSSVDGYMIGDSEADIKCAKKVNLTSVSVLSGLRNFSYLQQLSPDIIITNITKFKLSDN